MSNKYNFITLHPSKAVPRAAVCPMRTGS